MTAVASPPASPTAPSPRKRRSLRVSYSNVDSEGAEYSSPYTSGTTNGTTVFSRRSSRTSQTSNQPLSPITPRPMSSKSSRPPSFSQPQRRFSRTSINSNRSIEHLTESGGLGNLADELEQAWDNSGEEEDQSNFLEGLREGVVDQEHSALELQSPYTMNDMHDFGFGMVVQSPQVAHGEDGTSPSVNVSLSPKEGQSRGHRKSGHARHESKYDGSDYGPESDSEEQADGLPPIVRRRMRDLENLTRMCVNPEDAVSEGGGTVRRTIRGLKELSSQSNIEYGVTRLITAYTSMATYRSNKTRDLFTQSHLLMYGGVFNLPEEMIELLLDDITELSSLLQFLRQQNPLLSLQILGSQTEELGQTLRSITDLLQEFRLAANAATRKLKSVRDMVEDMSIEEDLVENSIMLIQAGDWDRRCRTRQAARSCQEICEGFANRWGLDFDANLVCKGEAVAKAKPGLTVMVSA
ncbi:hypothetical protein B0A52_01857 [Exophiala mesophila]|uniref:Uncharacterized protein n=1 Tax=Exophiala mesophila TaxID=212818 RepID=A0A438NE73_EXOME|nr:hypothetical protein B0A52_01857 [Exophiala mesophila]